VRLIRDQATSFGHRRKENGSPEDYCPDRDVTSDPYPMGYYRGTIRLG